MPPFRASRRTTTCSASSKNRPRPSLQISAKFSPPKSTAIVALIISGLAVSGAIFLILELDQPFEGVIRISSEPLRNAMSQFAK
jgi:hypothetical protein